MKKRLCFSIALAMLAICLMACTPSVVTPPDNTTAREAGQILLDIFNIWNMMGAGADFWMKDANATAG